MEKTCFVIMPISDNPDYEDGHFDRVYNFIIKPACELSNFNPIRADDVLSTNHIALDIIKKIIDSDMALCDLSSQNPNVLYELGIRQAFNKPVTLIKDSRTKRIFDIQGFRDLEYDESLRIDNVNDSIETLAEILTNTYKNEETDINSLVKLLGISPAELKEKTNISIETELILNNLSSINNRLRNIEDKAKSNEYKNQPIREQPIEETIDDDEYGEKYSLKEISNLKKGDKVVHRRFGIGTLINIDGNHDNLSNFIGEFEFQGGRKKLMLRFASLYKIL